MATSVPIPTDTFKLGFIGAGKLAESIARGVLKSGILPASRISTAHRDSQRRDVFSSFGVKVYEHNHQVAEDSDVIIFLVKPQIVKEVVLQFKPSFTKDKLLVSIAAGIKLADLQVNNQSKEQMALTAYLLHDGNGQSTRFIRVMPNTPSAVGQAASVISLGGTATEEDGLLMDSLFGAIGRTWRAKEKMFDAVTGVSGSGPAYIFRAIEALADGGVAAGLPRDLAAGLAAQTVLGAATMVVNTGKHPGQLKDDVASAGGTTISAIHELEKGGFRGVLMNAVVAAANRSKEFSKK